MERNAYLAEGYRAPKFPAASQALRLRELGKLYVAWKLDVVGKINTCNSFMMLSYLICRLGRTARNVITASPRLISLGDVWECQFASPLQQNVRALWFGGTRKNRQLSTVSLIVTVLLLPN